MLGLMATSNDAKEPLEATHLRETIKDVNNDDKYDISELLSWEAEKAINNGTKGILPCEEREGGCYPNTDLAIWLRSCTHEVVKPIEGKVSGSIPMWLDGNLLQNGPGKFFFGANDVFKHLFDGSALIQKFIIKDGKVQFQCRFLRSRSFIKNLQAGRIAVSEFGTKAKNPKKNFSSRLAMIKRIDDVMTDNAMISINAIGSDYYAFYESPFLLQLDVGSLKTKNRIDMNKAFGAFTNASHPHFDSRGNMITVGLKSGLLGPYYTITRIPLKDETAKIGIDLELDDDIDDNSTRNLAVERFNLATELATQRCRWPLEPGYMHSFCVTENYFILVEQPFSLNITKMVKSVLSKDMAMVEALKWYGDEPTLFHLIPKSGGERKTYKSTAFFYLHTINSYEEDGHVVVDISTYKSPNMLYLMYIDKLATAQSNPDYARLFKGRPHRYVIPLDQENPKVTLPYTKATAEIRKDGIWLMPQMLADVGCETPTIYYKRVSGKRYNYFYSITSDVDDPQSAGKIHKVNVMTGELKSWYEPNVYCGEPIFVPNPPTANHHLGEADEDDGVLISSMIKGSPDVYYTGVLILDAKNLKELGRAEFQLKSPVPKPLHGCYAPRARSCQTSHA